MARNKADTKGGVTDGGATSSKTTATTCELDVHPETMKDTMQKREAQVKMRVRGKQGFRWSSGEHAGKEA